MEHEQNLQLLKTLLAEISDINRATAVLGWDQQTYMPPAGAEGRGHQIATLQQISHIKQTSDDMGKLLDELAPYAAQLDPTSFDACLIRVARRNYDKSTKVPTDFVVKVAMATTVSYEAWTRARAQNNFEEFRPHMELLLEMAHEYAGFFAPYEHVYDPMLDDYEPGLKTNDIKTIFNTLRPQQVELIKQIAGRPQVDNSFLFLEYDEQKQWDFGVGIITQMGYDWKRGRQDKTVHPFTTSFGMNDVRITTRVNPKFLPPALFGTLHETGHAMYELGSDPALDRTPLAGGASAGIHESQSRMWENMVGRSLPFWQHFYPRLQEIFPSQVGNISLDQFYKGINKVQPSFIRVEADEATYNLHIMLRMELEIALMEKQLEVKDLPEAWNSRCQEYLGITPPDNAKGVLQDVHWSSGMIGYFPSYALGNLIAAQLWEHILADIPNLPEQISQGEFAPWIAWLRENLHRFGSMYEPQDLIQKVTGSKIDPAPYMRYLEQKFRSIYNF